jgi:molybdenum cofactor cytidylyltransferase
MIRGVVEAGLRSKADEVIVILGWEADKIKKALDDLPCRFVVNKNYEKGQSSSVKTGLKEIGETTQAVLILPGDVAKIDASSINLVIDEYVRRKHAIIVAAHKSKPGHPILFDRQLFNEIEEIDEQTFGLKSVVKKHGGTVRFIESGSSNVLRDVDTPKDLEEL